MNLAQVAIVLAGLGALVTARLAVMFLRDTQSGMRRADHALDRLPEVMTGRYIAMTAMAVFCAVYGDLTVIAALFATFAFMGFADAFIYARVGLPTLKHTTAGIAALIVMIVALLAGPLNGAA